MTGKCGRGQTMVEFALILLLVAVALVAAFNLFRGGLSGSVDTVANNIVSVTP